METRTNQWNEIVTTWESTKHPENPDFMQTVRWTVWEKPDGRITVGYNLGSGIKTVFVRDITKEEAIEKYS